MDRSTFAATDIVVDERAAHDDRLSSTVAECTTSAPAGKVSGKVAVDDKCLFCVKPIEHDGAAIIVHYAVRQEMGRSDPDRAVRLWFEIECTTVIGGPVEHEVAVVDMHFAPNRIKFNIKRAAVSRSPRYLPNRCR